MHSFRSIGLFGALLVLSASSAAFGQRFSQDTRTYFDYGEPFYSSMVESPDAHSIDIRLNTASDMFSFLRSDKPSLKARGEYYAIREVTAEVVEKGFTEALVNTDLRDTLFVQSYKETTSKTVWHPRNIHIMLPKFDSNKSYAVRLEVRDNILSRAAIRPVIADLRKSDFNSNSADSTGIALGDITLIDSQQGDSIISNAKGNTYRFSRDIIGSIPMMLSEKLVAGAEVDITVKQTTNPFDATAIGDRGHVIIPASDIHKNQEIELTSTDSTMHFRLVPSQNNVMTAFFTIPGRSYDQGIYSFSVRAKSGAAERKRTSDFKILWPDMPISLEDPVDAVEPLTHILSDDQVKEIRSGSKAEMMKKVLTYWKTQDPTPGTAYNERMAVFYQRVDYADFNFGTSHLLNGVMTDRGRIYLLYGAPTNIERTLLPGQSPVETWSYSNNVKRVFRFQDESGHGDYHLTNVQPVAQVN